MTDFMKRVKQIIIFLDHKEALTLYYLTYLYEFLILHRRNKTIYTSELNGVLSLFTKVIKSPVVSTLPLASLTTILYFYSKHSKNMSSIVTWSLARFLQDIL
jgi:hypothetical protein